MINFRDYFVGFGFLVLLIIFIVQKMRTRSNVRRKLCKEKIKGKTEEEKENEFKFIL